MAATDTAAGAEVAEAIRSAIARYAQASDDGRGADVAALYCEDGELEILDQLVVGREALAARTDAAAASRTAPQKHCVFNIVVTASGEDRAEATSDFVFLRIEGGAWQVAIAGRYHDRFERVAGQWLIRRRQAILQTAS